MINPKRNSYISVFFKNCLPLPQSYLEQEESVELKLLFFTNEIACLMNPPPHAPIDPITTVNKK